MTLPRIIIPTRAAFAAIPPSIREAALGVGASRTQVIMHHVLPLAMPGILSGCLLAIILSMGTFLTPDLLGGPDSEMIGNLIARQFSSSRDWPFGAALSFLLLYFTFLIL